MSSETHKNGAGSSPVDGTDPGLQAACLPQALAAHRRAAQADLAAAIRADDDEGEDDDHPRVDLETSAAAEPETPGKIYDFPERPSAKVTAAEGPKAEAAEGRKAEAAEGPKAEAAEGPKAEAAEGPKAEAAEGPKAEAGEAAKVTAAEAAKVPVSKGDRQKYFDAKFDEIFQPGGEKLH